MYNREKLKELYCFNCGSIETPNVCKSDMELVNYTSRKS